MNALPVDQVPSPLRAALERDWQEILAALEPAAHEAVQARLAADAWLAAALARVLCCSQFVGQALARDAGLLPGLLASGDLARSYDAREIRERLALALPADADEARLAAELRRLRRREMVRIVWRDLQRTADLVETTRDLTWLAEATVEAAVAHGHAQLAARHGEPRGRDCGAPQRLVVLGMGKLGACELNLSSDIDLIFAYPAQGETDGERALSNQEFFTRLGQRVIKAIDARTQDGFVFRVDMRLRPYGDAGALALNFDAMEEYYQDQGRDWERYAMIKARVIAGDRAAGEQLLAALRPFTYRRYIDFSAIESLRGMKAMINREVQRRGKATDVKLGAGGIREIEFIVQSFQLIRGGRETALQERRLLVVLELLGSLGHLPPAVVAELGEAYVFLRNTEHAIQARADQQTQALPEDEDDRLRLAFALG
ncbi:MAG: bifunctional [glutamate--ammonia ligase]-adenylyl-L-tyrosine phosphorylase/[glutamate--ammonia-ligase] adenylyltransferase, partial [Pseudomonadales bacterium]|nr:bifunctional [glutamate--ammonia ligase]-adenylyl-L-tyrosine phosphorylase/[glutamate--ammonia-ligase] adenylyltransferase [Pseudomonadales bacterium]